MKSEKSLAIVIPFYKSNYFCVLLDSLKNQTNRKFSVFIGDDCSPSDVQSLCEPYFQDLNIKIVRFRERRGGVCLASQWNRCINLAKEFEWIWVVPDDDLLSINAVDEVFSSMALADEQRASCIFVPPTSIDGDGVVVRKKDFWPTVLSSEEFYLPQLLGDKAGMTLGNVVYRAESLLANGGFVGFPRGWGSDHATALSVIGAGAIVSVKTATLFFRMSDANISSDDSDYREKMRGRAHFVNWFANSYLPSFQCKCHEEFIRYAYLKSEYYVLKVWPRDVSLIISLFHIADSCGYKLSIRSKLLTVFRFIFRF